MEHAKTNKDTNAQWDERERQREMRGKKETEQKGEEQKKRLRGGRKEEDRKKGDKKMNDRSKRLYESLWEAGA